MSANFTPNKNDIGCVRPFRHWCQKVLPLVYDDSLSYYELLCKVTNFLNETINNVNELGEDVTNLYVAYNQLQDYVNTAFDELTLQEEVNNKLDEMAEDGTLSKLLSTATSNVYFLGAYGFLPNIGVDVSDKLQAFIDNIPSGTLVFPSGEYILHDIIVKDDVKLVGNNTTIKINYNGVVQGVFIVTEHRNIVVKGFTFLSENNSGGSLYMGGLVYGNNSTNITVEHCMSFNTRYLCAFQRSSNINVGFNYCENHSAESVGLSAVFLGLCKECNVYKNNVLGFFGDGAISIFGLSKNCVVNDNVINTSYLESYFERQGITVDSESSFVEVKGNTLINCYYGIDIKTLCENINCHDNYCISCKCGIAVRQGEIDTGRYMPNVSVKNNTIMINPINMVDQMKYGGMYSAVGILSENNIQGAISGNTISVSASTDKVIALVYCNTVNVGAYNNPVSITNNVLKLTNNLGRYTYVPADESVCIYIKGCNCPIISNNQCVLSGDTSRILYFINNVGSYGAVITSNSIKHANTNEMIVGDMLYNTIFTNNNCYLGTTARRKIGNVQGIKSNNINTDGTTHVNTIAVNKTIQIYVHDYSNIMVDITRQSATEIRKSSFVYYFDNGDSREYLINETETDDLTVSASYDSTTHLLTLTLTTSFITINNLILYNVSAIN